MRRSGGGINANTYLAMSTPSRFMQPQPIPQAFLSMPSVQQQQYDSCLRQVSQHQKMLITMMQREIREVENEV
jgi:hypothetical protein